jgi:hypothetical protein
VKGNWLFRGKLVCPIHLQGWRISKHVGDKFLPNIGSLQTTWHYNPKYHTFQRKLFFTKVKTLWNTFTFFSPIKLPISLVRYALLTTYPKQFSYPLTNSCWLDVEADTELVCYLHDIVSCLPHTYVVLKESNTWNRFMSIFCSQVGAISLFLIHHEPLCHYWNHSHTSITVG